MWSSKHFIHTQPLFRKLELLNIGDVYNQPILKFCFRLYNDDTPYYLSTHLTSIEDNCQNYHLRYNHIRTPVLLFSCTTWFFKNGSLFKTTRILQSSTALTFLHIPWRALGSMLNSILYIFIIFIVTYINVIICSKWK